MTAPEAFASVGISTILGKVTDMERHMAVISADLTTFHATAAARLADLDHRMDKLEDDRWPWKKIAGLVGAAAFIASLIFGLMAQQPADNGRPPPPRPTSGP